MKLIQLAFETRQRRKIAKNFIHWGGSVCIIGRESVPPYRVVSVAAGLE